MAGKVFFSVSMSLDGFIAPVERRDDPDVQRSSGRDLTALSWNFLASC